MGQPRKKPEVRVGPDRVLIVETDDSLRTLMANYLFELGSSHVDGQLDGWKGIEALNTEFYDLVILDWKHKDPTGEELYRHVRNHSRYSEVPILLISGFVTKDDIRIAQKDRFSRFLVKPFTQEVLEDVVMGAYRASYGHKTPANPRQKPGTSPSGHESQILEKGGGSAPTGSDIVIARGASRQKSRGIDIIENDEQTQTGRNLNIDKGSRQRGASEIHGSDTGTQSGRDMIQKGHGPGSDMNHRQAGPGPGSDMSGTFSREDLGTAFDGRFSSESSDTNSWNETQSGAGGLESFLGKADLSDPEQEKKDKAIPDPIPRDLPFEEPKKESFGISNDMVEQLSNQFGVHEVNDIRSPEDLSASAIARGLKGSVEAPKGADYGTTLHISEEEKQGPDAADILANSRPVMTNAVLIDQQIPVYAPQKALVVDNEDSVIRFLSTKLKKIGVAVVDTATEGSQASELIESNNYDLIIIDWRIRGSSGIKLYNRLRRKQQSKEAPVMVSSGQAAREDFRILTESPCTQFMEKPFQEGFFEQKIIETCRDASIQSSINSVVEKLLRGLPDDPYQIGSIVEGLMKKVPNPFQFVITCGRHLLRKDHFAAAEQVFEIALKLDPKSVTAMTEIAKVWHINNQPEKAQRMLLQAQVFSPESVERLCLLGEVGLSMRDTIGARKFFKEALELNEKEETAHAGLILADHIDDKSITFDNRPVQIQFASNLNMIGISYSRNKDLDKASEYYKASMCFLHNPETLSRVRFNLGLAYVRSRDFHTAELWFQRAAEIAPADFMKPKEYREKTLQWMNMGRHEQLMQSPESFIIIDDDDDQMIIT